MHALFVAILACAVASSSIAVPYPAANPGAIAKVRAGELTTAHASWWGFDPNDATAALQAAIDSGAKKVIVENMQTPWIVRPIQLAGDQELVLENGVVLLAKRGEFTNSNDSLLSASGKRNVRITGSGATLRMWRDDYDRPPYKKAEWRHALSIRSCTGVSMTGLTILESGGDGIYLGVSQKGVTNTDVIIRDVVCDKNYRQGISVISARNLLIENTVLRATAGTAPMAGIDFEPNHSSEELVNCVMRNCMVEGNRGDGFLFALHNLTRESPPISIRLENCRSVGDRNGFRFNTGNSEPRTCVPGWVEVIDCQFETSEQAGIAISNKPADGCRVRFERCRIVEAAPNQPKAAPILLSTSADSTLSVGGMEFTDVVVVDSQDRHPLGYADRAGGLKLAGLSGTLTVEHEGQRTAYPLDQGTLDAWFPFQAFKPFPPFSVADLRWEPREAQSQREWSCRVRQRGHGEFLLWAEAGQEIAFTLGLKRVGKTGTPEMSVAIVTPAGERHNLPKMTGEGEQSYTFRAEQAGPHRIVCGPGSSTVHVVSCNCPVTLYSQRAPFHLLGAAGDVYFCVPAGVEEFAIRISGGGEGENAKAVVYDAAGQKVGEKDNIEGHQFLLHRPATAGTEIWRLQLARPAQGVIEDYYVQLQGLPPLLATQPDALPRPLPRDNASATYFPPPDAQGGWRALKDAEEIRRVAGLDVKRLDEVFDVAAASTKNGGVLVVRHGWLVYEKYFGRGHREATPNLASCGKSFTSIAIGILMAEHPELFPEGLDQKVFAPKYLPPEAFPLSDPAMAEIKLGQLLTFSAGIRGNNPCYVNGQETTIDPPGPDGWASIVDAIALGKRDHISDGQRYSATTLWCLPGGGYSYATASIHIASMIVRHGAGMELQEYLQKHLAEPMGWGRWGYGYKYAKEVTHTPGGGGITLRATDMLRFGYLLLHEGRWGDRQLVPAAYVRHARQQSPYNPHYAYSLQFNVNTDGHIPEYPRDAFWKSGSGAHMLYVVPSLDLVVWKLAGRDGQYDERDTGVPLPPEIAQGSESCRNWKPTINEREGQRLVLSKVIEAIIAPQVRSKS